MINPIVKTIELGDGRTITLETGKLAKQADGAVCYAWVTPCCWLLFVQQKMQFPVQTSCRFR